VEQKEVLFDRMSCVTRALQGAFAADFCLSVLYFSVLLNRLESVHGFPLSACLFPACLYTQIGMVSNHKAGLHHPFNTKLMLTSKQ
jgi:hypothetical protein